MDQPFLTVPPEMIKDATATDAYFERTDETLAYADKNPRVVAEVTADQFSDGSYEVIAGLNEVADLFEGMPVDVDALPEGTLFDGGPVLTIEGPYRSFLRHETPLLGLLSPASAYATRALAARTVAESTPLFSFGSRHLHPVMAAVVERSALIGGFDGISNVAAGELIGREATGTMPHSLLLVFGPDHMVEAWTAFDEAVDDDVARIALCDTFTDERDESLEAARALGDALDGVRLDTTGSRRGDFRHIVKEVRWELDANGFEHVDIILSGGIDLDLIEMLHPHADGFGVGSYITDAPPVDFALDIVEVEGQSTSKRGKLSGRKAVYRTRDGEHVIRRASQSSPTDAESLLQPLVRDGEIVATFDIDQAATRAREDAETVEFDPWHHG